MKPNQLLNIVGITLILISAGGLAALGGEGEVSEEVKRIRYNIDFPEMQMDGPGDQMSISDGGSGSSTLGIDVHNLTEVLIQVDWNDNFPLAIFNVLSIDVTVTGPGGVASESDSRTGSSGTFLFEFPNLNTPHESATKSIPENTDPWTEVQDDYPAMDNGTGDWQIQISVDRTIRNRPVVGSVDFTLSSNFEHFMFNYEIAEDL